MGYLLIIITLILIRWFCQDQCLHAYSVWQLMGYSTILFVTTSKIITLRGELRTTSLTVCVCIVRTWKSMPVAA